MSHEETKRDVHTFDLRGKWLPSISPFLTGPKNFADLCNLMPGDDGLEGVSGYTRVTSSVVSADYPAIRNGIQLRQKIGSPSRILAQAVNAAGTESVILEQTAASAAYDIPAVKNFEANPIHTDADGAGLGRFCRWPQNTVAYCNGKETLIYGGDEVYPAGFMVGSTPIGNEIANAIDYTDAVRNTLQTPGNVARIAGDVDVNTVLYLSFEEGATAADFVDESSAPHTITASGTMTRATDYPKFGQYAGKAGSAGKLTAAASADWSFGTGDFTLEWQGRLGYGTHGICGQYTDASNYWRVTQTNSYYAAGGNTFAVATVSFKAVVAGTTVAEYSFFFRDPFYKNNWYNKYRHIELTRHGSTMYCFREGLGPNSTTGSTAIGTAAMPDFSTADLDLFRVHNGTYQASGNFDEVRISKGIARHTTPFVAPTAAYGGESQLFVVLTNRPIDQVKLYLAGPNPVSGATITGVVWDGTGYTDLDLTDGSAGLTVSAVPITFTSTVGIAARKLIAGQCRYVYAFTLSDGMADVYQVTVRAPIQPICDIWDGTARPVLGFSHYHSSKTVDNTMVVLEEMPGGVDKDLAEDYVANVGGLTSSEYIDIKTAERACGFRITLYAREDSRVNVTVATLIPHYWNGRTYIAPNGISDGTLDAETGTKTLNQSGDLSWSVPDVSQEFPRTDKGKTAWSYRLTPTATLNNEGGSNKVWIEKVQAIPAPQLPSNLGYKFPFNLGNRPMLCNLATSGEGNRVDYPLTDSTEGWNGEDSTFGEGRKSIYIGDDEDLTSACEIFTRLSQSIYSFGLFFKAHQTYILNGYDAESYKWYPLSKKIGNPAPLTLDTYELADSADRESSRTIAAWLSHKGPYLYDSGAIRPIPGLECFFDEKDSRCVNMAAIEKSCGWFGANGHYNLQFPSGAGQTENNIWVAHDFTSGRWYPKIPSCNGPYLTAVIPVSDAAGKQYHYGIRPGAYNYMMRLEYGNTWDGSAIAQYLETGEFLPSNDIWDFCKLLLSKLVYKPVEETVTLTVQLIPDGKTAASAVTLASITLSTDTTRNHIRYNKKLPINEFKSCRIRIAATTSATPRGLQLLVWSAKHEISGKDDQ